MTTTRHTPIATRAAATAATLNAPLSQLDSAVVAVEEDVTQLFASVGSGAGWASTLDATATSGQKVVPVTSTTGAVVGMPVYLGLTSGTHETGVIESIADGVSVTLAANLASTYPSGTPISATPAEVADARGGYSTLAEKVRSRGLDVRDYGAIGGGAEDDAAAIRSAIAGLPSTPLDGQGGDVYLPRGVYGIGSTIVIDRVGIRFGGSVGGQTTTGQTTLKALPGFVGPLLKYAIASGDKGAWVHDLRLDGNSEAGVTAGVEYADDTISRADLDGVTIVNCPIGILTGTNQQSYLWERVRAAEGIATGVSFGSDNRQITARTCIFGGTTRAVVIGVDNAVSADKCQNIVLDNCELYAMGAAPSGAVLVRNADSAVIRDSYIEVALGSATPFTALVTIGTATAAAQHVHLSGNRLGGNAVAAYGVELVNAPAAVLLPNTYIDTVTGQVKNSDTDSGAIILGQTVDVTTGMLVVIGENTIAKGAFKTAVISERDAGNNAFEARTTGDTVARYAIRNNGGIMAGNGSTAADTHLVRLNGGKWYTSGMMIALVGLGVGNSAAATTPGSVVKKIQIFDAAGASLGYIAVYNAIT